MFDSTQFCRLRRNNVFSGVSGTCGLQIGAVLDIVEKKKFMD
jgi:hypothetical protein